MKCARALTREFATTDQTTSGETAAIFRRRPEGGRGLTVFGGRLALITSGAERCCTCGDPSQVARGNGERELRPFCRLCAAIDHQRRRMRHLRGDWSV